MNAADRAERVIKPMGLYVAAGLTLLLAMVKLTGLREWSWWRIALPLMIILGFMAVYIVTGFLYFSLVPVKERPPEEENVSAEDATTGYPTTGRRCSGLRALQ